MLWFGKPLPASFDWQPPSCMISTTQGGRACRLSNVLSRPAFLRAVRTTARADPPLAGRPLHPAPGTCCGRRTAPAPCRAWWSQPARRSSTSWTTPSATSPHAPQLTHLPSQRTARMLQLSPSLASPYAPSLPSLGGHLQTLMGAMARKKPVVVYRRELVPCTDGGVIALDWLEGDSGPHAALPAAAPVLLLLAGLTGGSESGYVRHSARAAVLAGFRPVVYNSRGCGSSPVLTPRLYSAADTADLRQAVAHILCHKHAEAPLLAAGWSIGANLLVHLLSQDGAASPVLAAVCLANPWDLQLSDVLWRKGLRRFYDVHLATRLSALFVKHSHLWLHTPDAAALGGDCAKDSSAGVAAAVGPAPGLADGAVALLPESGLGGVRPRAAAAARTLRELDAALTIHTFGFKDVDEYYRTASSCYVLHGVRIPMLCLQALDDPIAPAQAIPYANFLRQANLVLATTRHGGHLGWIERRAGSGMLGGAWTDAPMLEFLAAAVSEQGRERSSSAPQQQPAGEVKL